MSYVPLPPPRNDEECLKQIHHYRKIIKTNLITCRIILIASIGSIVVILLSMVKG